MPNRFAGIALAPLILVGALSIGAASAKDWTTAAIALEGAYEEFADGGGFAGALGAFEAPEVSCTFLRD